MKNKETLIIFWIIIALISLIIISMIFKTSTPVFTFLWLLISLLVVLFKKDSLIVGFKKVDIKLLLTVTIKYFIISMLVIALIELTTHTYQYLIEFATYSTNNDLTFFWLNKYNGILGYVLMFVVSSLITIFAEELFFRGLLLQVFKKRFNYNIAILLQALLFGIPHIILALIMPLTQGIILVFGYGFLIYGVIGGWAAHKTNSVWPGLIVANINNLILTMLYFN